MNSFTMLKLNNGRTLYIKEWWQKEEIINLEKINVTKLWFLIYRQRIELVGEDEVEDIPVKDIYFARRLNI